MYKTRVREVFASEIGEILNCELVGRDFVVTGPGSLRAPRDKMLTYTSRITPEVCRLLSGVSDVLVLTGDIEQPLSGGCSYILTPRPRLAFAHVLNEFFVERDMRQTAPTATVHPYARIGRNVIVGSQSVIGADVSVGDNTIIMNSVVITGPVDVGVNCVIKDNSTIGSEGYGFEFDETGVPIHVPYTGRIIIGDNVWIGSNTSIERAEVDDTIIAPFVKIDDLVHIGERCFIDERTMVAAGSVISAGVVVGKDCWLAPHTSVRDGVSIGDNVLVGIGAVVIRDLKKDGVYVGNPAHFLRPR